MTVIVLVIINSSVALGLWSMIHTSSPSVRSLASCYMTIICIIMTIICIMCIVHIYIYIYI